MGVDGDAIVLGHTSSQLRCRGVGGRRHVEKVSLGCRNSAVSVLRGQKDLGGILSVGEGGIEVRREKKKVVEGEMVFGGIQGESRRAFPMSKSDSRTLLEGCYP
jgi:hypothetical protein